MELQTVLRTLILLNADTAHNLLDRLHNRDIKMAASATAIRTNVAE